MGDRNCHRIHCRLGARTGGLLLLVHMRLASGSRENRSEWNWIMNNLLKLILPITIVLMPAATQARDVVPDDGNELLGFCTSSDAWERGTCFGYIRGSDATLSLWALSTKAKPYCAPAGVTVGQVKDVVVSYITRHAATRNDSAPLLILKAQIEAWPCNPT